MAAERPEAEDLQDEVARLRRASDEERVRNAVLESETRRLKRENRRLSERSEFAEDLAARVREANEKLEILHSLTKELASFDLDGVLEVSLKRIPYLVGARYASVYVYERAQHRLVLKQHTHGHEIDRMVDLAEAPDSLMALAVRRREILCIDDLGRFRAGGEGPRRPHRRNYRTESCVVAPLIAAGEVEGVLNLADRFDERPFDPGQHLKMIRQACELVAVSLHNARLFAEVQRAARTDSLTGLRNHQAFAEALDVECKRALRYGSELSLLMVKVHFVGLVNANYGHPAGDALLRAVARRLRGNVREVDLPGRTGGTEFGIILPEQTLEGALVVARRLSDVLAATRADIGGGATCEIRTTFGVAHYERAGGGSELVQRALEHLARAREAGESIGYGA